MADTATMGVVLQRGIGAVRDTCHAGAVLLYGSNHGAGTDGNEADSNPTGFKGIMANSKNVRMSENMARYRLFMSYGSPGGSRNENDSLPEAESDDYATAVEPMRSHYSGFTLTGQLIAAAERSEAEFEAPMTESLKRTTTGAKMNLNRQAWGTGNGVLSALSANEAAAQTVISVVSTVNYRIGLRIDGVTIADGTVIEPARKITAIDRTNKTITVTPALTTGLTATTDGFVLSSSNSTVAAPNNSHFRETNGLGNIIDSSGTLHGISPSLWPQWASYEEAMAGAGISDAAIRRAKRSVGFETGLYDSAMEFAILSTQGMRDAYAETQLPLKRHVNTQQLEGGFEAIMVDGNPFITDDSCPVGTVFGARLNKLEWAMMQDWDWMSRDGAVLKQIPGKDAYRAYLFMYGNFMTTHRGSHWKLTGFSGDTDM